MDREKRSALTTSRSVSIEEQTAPSESKEAGFDGRSAARFSFFQIRPLAGLVALLIAACCIFASLGILVGSDGQSITSWPIQPAVYLAIIAAVTNSALQVARTQALPIDWWYTALRGNTVKELERRWEAGTGIASAVLIGNKYTGKVSVVSLAMAFFIIDGPLLQRASTVGPGTRSSNVTMEVMLSPEVPTGFSGFASERSAYYSQHATDVIHGWLHNESMIIDVTGCKGTCTGSVRGPGMVKANCSSYSWPVNKEMLHSPNATWGTWKAIDLENPGLVAWRLPWFEVTMVPLRAAAGREGAFLRVGRMEFFNLEGAYKEEVCDLLPAVVNYQISIEHQRVMSIDAGNPGNVIDFVNNTLAPGTDLSHQKIPVTLDVLTWFVASSVLANTTAVMEVPPLPDEVWQPTWFSQNREAISYVNLSNTYYDTNFFDPMPDIIAGYNEVLFRAALKSASWPDLMDRIDPGLSPRQTVHAQQHEQLDAFRSDLRWWAGAVVIEILTIFILLPLFNHWWRLGRIRSLSPFELALAFDAPLLRDVPSNAGAEGIIDRLGNVRVQLSPEKERFCAASDHDPDTDEGSLPLRDISIEPQ